MITSRYCKNLCDTPKLFSINFENFYHFRKRKQYLRPTRASSIHQQLDGLPGLTNFWPTGQKFFLKKKKASKGAFKSTF